MPNAVYIDSPFHMLNLHRDRVFDAIGSDCAFISGGVVLERYNTDRDLLFVQESTFYYLTGCTDENCCALFDGLERKMYIFYPDPDEEHIMWHEFDCSLEYRQAAYGELAIVLYKGELNAMLLYRGKRVFHVIGNVPQIPAVEIPNAVEDLAPIIDRLRLFKDAVEIDYVRKACAANSAGFNFAMTKFRPGMLEAEFAALHEKCCARNGCPRPSFGTVTASGVHASILHYIDDTSVAEDGQVFLCDAGCRYKYYCSDHTRVVPVGRRFTEKQEYMYNTVLDANMTVISMAKEGARFEDLHFAANLKMLEGLRRHGLLKTEFSIEEQLEAGIAFIFQPHGLGHHLGLDPHDTGAVVGPKQQDPRLKYLRFSGPLKAGMIVTIEPGLYFVDKLLDAALSNPLQAKHLNIDVINAYKAECGGYRIEDNILITQDGCDVFPGPAKQLAEIYALRDYAFSD